MNREREVVGSTNSTGSSKEQGDFLRLRRQQMTDEQQQTKVNMASPHNNLNIGIPNTNNMNNSSLTASPGNTTVSSSSSSPTAAARSAGFTSRFLSSWKK